MGYNDYYLPGGPYTQEVRAESAAFKVGDMVVFKPEVQSMPSGWGYGMVISCDTPDASLQVSSFLHFEDPKWNRPRRVVGFHGERETRNVYRLDGLGNTWYAGTMLLRADGSDEYGL